MYKKPSKRIQRLQLFALYSIMTVTVMTVVMILVLVVSNYGFNRETGTLEQRGLVQFASIPSGANITIDGAALGARTSTKHSVEPGEHSFVMSREGYEPWRLTTSVPAGSLVWLNYARLVPSNRTNEVINTYSSLAASSASPDKRSILLQPDRTRPEFRLVDISRDNPSGKTITLNSALFDEPSKNQTPEVTLGQWDEGGRYIIVRYTLGNKTDVIVLDTRNPSRSVNVSREFSLPIDRAILSGRSGNILYVASEGSLRKIDIAGGTISRSLVSGIEYFSLYDTNTVTFVAQSGSDDDAVRTAGVYREGDESPIVLRSASPDVSLSIATSTYYGSTYTAIAEDKQLTVYRGQHDNGMSGLTRVTSKELPDTVTSVEFNDTGSYVLARSATAFSSYGLERQLLVTTDLEGVASRNLFWIDPMHVGLVVEGQLTMRNIDGTNTHSLTAVSAGHRGTLSRNGTYFYSIGDQVEGDGLQLQRFRMILQ